MEMRPVASSNVAEMGYDAATQTLRVRFKRGGGGDYSGVPEWLYKEVVSAQSVGSALANRIVGNYSYTKAS